ALIVSFLAILAVIAQIIGRIIRPDIPQGLATVIVVSLFLGAINLLSLSFIAEYVGKIFEEVKQRPLYVVAKTLNFEERAMDAVRERAAPSGRDVAGAQAG